MNDKYIVYFISKIKGKMIRFIEQRLNEYGMNELIVSHGNILTALYDNGGQLTMSQIAKMIGKDRSTVTPLINKLLKLGYIRKEKDETDKRISYITLTDNGRGLEGKFNAISQSVYETAYEGFSEQEKDTLLKLLKKLNVNFSR